MKILLFLAKLGAALAVLILVAGFPVRNHYASQAQLSQRIERSDSDSLFGSKGAPLGEPQMYIVTDPKAYLPETGEGGVKLLDEAYLNKNGIYPLQLKSVDFALYWTRIGSAAAIVVCGLVWVLLARRLARRASVS